MERYINADLFKKNTNPVWYQPDDNSEYDGLYDKKDIEDMIDAQPTADVQEVKHGHWVDSNTGEICPWDEQNKGCPAGSCHCSICGVWLTASDEMPAYGYYCPNCGAKMDEEINNE